MLFVLAVKPTNYNCRVLRSPHMQLGVLQQNGVTGDARAKGGWRWVKVGVEVGVVVGASPTDPPNLPLTLLQPSSTAHKNRQQRGSALDELLLLGRPLGAAAAVEGAEGELLDGVVALRPLDIVASVHLRAIVLDALYAIRLPCTNVTE